MSYPNPTLCRVALHADTVQVDLALPAGVPVGALLPAIVDIVATRGGGQHIARAAVPYQLSCPGATALDTSKTLAQHNIRDGAVLLLSRATTELPPPRFDDLAEQVSATVRARTRPWTPHTARLTASLAAVWLAAIAGFLAVPGGPGASNVLLAGVAAATAAALAIQLGEAGPAMIAVCCLAILAASAALVAVLTQTSPQVIGALVVVVSIGVLQVAARVSVWAAGLSQRPGSSSVGVAEKTVRGRDLLTGLVAASAAAAALGVIVAAVGTSGFGGVVLAAVSGAALLLRTRWHTDRSQVAALVVGGITAFSASLVTAAVAAPHHLPWLCATAAALAVAALYLGFAAPVLSPVTQRGIELLEYLMVAAAVPVACWICGYYGAARGLSLM